MLATKSLKNSRAKGDSVSGRDVSEGVGQRCLTPFPQGFLNYTMFYFPWRRKETSSLIPLQQHAVNNADLSYQTVTRIEITCVKCFEQ